MSSKALHSLTERTIQETMKKTTVPSDLEDESSVIELFLKLDTASYKDVAVEHTSVLTFARKNTDIERPLRT